MIQDEMKMAEQAATILQGIVAGDHMITYIYTDHVGTPQDYEAWLLDLRTDKNHRITIWMEGSVVHKVTNLVDFDGRCLLGDHNQVNALGLLPVTIQADLTRIVMDTYNQSCPR